MNVFCLILCWVSRVSNTEKKSVVRTQGTQKFGASGNGDEHMINAFFLIMLQVLPSTNGPHKARNIICSEVSNAIFAWICNVISRKGVPGCEFLLRDISSCIY